MARILVVDDEAGITSSLKRFLESEGHEVAVAETGLEALALVNDRNFDVAFIDIVMPQLDGLTLMRRLVEDERQATIVAMSAFQDQLEVAERELGPVLFLTKPFTLEEVGIALRTALQHEA